MALDLVEVLMHWGGLVGEELQVLFAVQGIGREKRHCVSRYPRLAPPPWNSYCVAHMGHTSLPLSTDQETPLPASPTHRSRDCPLCCQSSAPPCRTSLPLDAYRVTPLIAPPLIEVGTAHCAANRLHPLVAHRCPSMHIR